MWQAAVLLSTNALIWGSADAEPMRAPDLRKQVPEEPMRFKALYADMKLTSLSDGCYEGGIVESCERLKCQLNDNYVTNAEELGVMNEVAWKCLTAATYNRRDGMKPCSVETNSVVVLPLVHCQKEDSWGYDMGLNPGDYGLGIKENGVWADWTAEEHQAITKQGFVYTMPLPAKPAKLSPFSDLAPTQETRCAEVMKASKRFEAYDAGALDAEGRGGSKDARGVSSVRSVKELRPVYGTAFLKANGFKLKAETKFFVTLKMTKDAASSKIVLAKEEFKFPYKKIEMKVLAPAKDQDNCKWDIPSCKKIKGDMNAENPLKDVGTPAAVFDYMKLVEDCHANSALARGDRKGSCAINYRVMAMVPMKDCGTSVGYDFGISLGDFGLEIENSIVYVNAPNEQVRGFEIGSSKTVNLARTVAHQHDFASFQPNAAQRCRIMMDLGQEGWTEVKKDLEPLIVDGVKHWAIGVRHSDTNPKVWLNGTSEFFNHGIPFVLKETHFAMYLKRQLNVGPNAEPDSRKYIKA